MILPTASRRDVMHRTGARYGGKLRRMECSIPSGISPGTHALTRLTGEEGVSAMEKRYQVFVSSTYEDLREERQEVMQALLELDCIPAGMELFPAADEDQWTLIKKVIDDCDYYLVIIGGRYGSIGSDGKSYTQMEYEYALTKQKHAIAFLHENPGDIPASKT